MANEAAVYASDPSFLLLVGTVLLLALAAQAAGHLMHVPRGTLLVGLGFLMGPEVLGVPFEVTAEQVSALTIMTLSMVGFLLGERLALRELRETREALVIGSVATFFTAALVFLAVWLVSGSLAAALVLAAIAPATAPAATLDVLHEAGARGPLPRIVSQIVAIDDVWTAVLYVLLIVLAERLLNHHVGWAALGVGLQEIVGGVLLGVALGLPMAWLTGRLRRGEPSLLEAIGFVFLGAGLAVWLGLSYLLTCITMGAVVANVARHHVRPFRSVEGIADPFIFIFFFLAGFSLELDMVLAMGWLGLVYVLARGAGRVVGGYLGGRWAGSSAAMRRRVGPALMPQAGIAIGLAMAATDRLPELHYILPIIVGSAIVFEVIGPSLTLHQLRKAAIETPLVKKTGSGGS